MKMRFSRDSIPFRTAEFLISFLAGFVLSGTNMAGVASFADISATGALKLPYSSAILAGSLVHCIAESSIGRNIVKIASMVLIVIFKMFFESRDDPKMCGIFTAVSVFASGTAVSAVIGEMFYKLIFYLFYAVLSGFTAYSASMVAESLKKRFVLDFSSSDGCAYAVVYTVLVASLCSLNVPFINIGIIPSVAVTMLASCYISHTGGVICGALTVCGSFLASVQCGMTVVLLPVTALLSGYMNRRKNISFVICFTAVSFLLTALTGVTQDNIYGMIDIIISAIIFTAVSPYCSDRWISTGTDRQEGELVSARVNFLSDSIENVRSEAVRISDAFSRSTSCGSVNIGRKCAEVCMVCENRSKCWRDGCSETLRGFRRFSDMYEISESIFPEELSGCTRKSEICSAFDSAVSRKMAEKTVMLRCSENRKVFYEQIRIMEELIRSTAERSEVRYSESVGRRVTAKLTRFGLFPSKVNACYNSWNRLNIEIYFDRHSPPDSFERVCDLISDELKLKMEYSPPFDSGKEVRLRIYERPKYAVEVYTASRCAEGETENGDTSMVFSDGTGTVYAVLSDGMGSGKSACVESRMAVKMFYRLVNGGVNPLSALKLVNSIMTAKSEEESFATFDAVAINLDNCGLKLIKSGAVSTMIRHRGSVTKVSSPSFPVGIYSSSDIFSADMNFEEGDIVVMFSDGISENEYRFIREMLLKTDDIRRIADEVCGKSDVFSSVVRSDDVTVIGIKVTKSA